jgi:hypothetical protein
MGKNDRKVDGRLFEGRVTSTIGMRQKSAGEVNMINVHCIHV